MESHHVIHLRLVIHRKHDFFSRIFQETALAKTNFTKYSRPCGVWRRTETGFAHAPTRALGGWTPSLAESDWSG
eukprot:scaffold251159_cov27-Tisochrysis_lutea.AAC.2